MPSNGPLEYSLIDFMLLNSLCQLNLIHNKDNRILDLLLTNVPQAYITKPLDLLTKLDSYHPQLLLVIPLIRQHDARSTRHIEFNFFKADYDQINSKLNTVD